MSEATGSVPPDRPSKRRRWIRRAVWPGVALLCCCAFLLYLFVRNVRQHTHPPARALVSVPLRTSWKAWWANHDWKADVDAHQQIHVAIARSHAVLSRALEDPKVANSSLLAGKQDPIRWLKNNLAIDFQLAPEIMEISLQGANSDEAAMIVNAIAQAFIHFATKDQRQSVQEKLFDSQKELERWERMGKVMTAALATAEGQAWLDLRLEIQEVDDKIRGLRGRVKELKERPEYAPCQLDLLEEAKGR